MNNCHRSINACVSGLKTPSLKDRHNYWNTDLTAKAITRFLTSLPKITPSIDDLPVADLCGPAEDLDRENAGEDRFMDSGNDTLLELLLRQNLAASQPHSEGLPIPFVVKMCLSTFLHDYEKAEFGQALACLDYLENMETTRRTALKAAARYFGITPDSWREVLLGNLRAQEWVERMEQDELELEALYATVYVDIRLWVCKIC